MSIKPRCPRTRRSVLLVVVVSLAAALVVWTVVFSSWNVCRSDLDDDVEALNAADAAAAGSSTGRSRRSANICLSPETHTGQRVNMSIDADRDLQR